MIRLISGIDSRYNEGCYALINYLLFGFFDVRKAELERLVIFCHIVWISVLVLFLFVFKCSVIVGWAQSKTDPLNDSGFFVSSFFLVSFFVLFYRYVSDTENGNGISELLLVHFCVPFLLFLWMLSSSFSEVEHQTFNWQKWILQF